jgi:hypothetical protein
VLKQRSTDLAGHRVYLVCAATYSVEEYFVFVYKRCDVSVIHMPTFPNCIVPCVAHLWVCVSCVSLYSLQARQDLVSVVGSKAYATEGLTFSRRVPRTQRCIFTFLSVTKTGTVRPIGLS